MTLAVRLDDVAVERGGLMAVQAVSMRVAESSWFGLIGANGSGKTSLLRALAGRLPFAGGRCWLGETDLTGDRQARAARFGFAPPADRLPGALRVRDLLVLAGGDVEQARERMGPVREALGIDSLLNRWVGDCSAGMRQRAAVALAFAGGQRQVILDEPFNWLDPVAAFDLREALRRIAGEGYTLITALHDLGTFAASCDAGLILADGKVALAIDAAALAEAAQAPHAFERRTIGLLRGSLAVLPG